MSFPSARPSASFDSKRSRNGSLPIRFALLTAFLSILFLTALSQPLQPGIPYITNFTVQDYGNQHAQNWAVVTDERGVLYFGNGNGVMEYDGIEWRLIQTTNKSLVRALARDSSGRIFVGGLGDFGYLARDSAGSLQYHSLLEFVEEGERDFGDVAKIHATPDGVYIQTFAQIFHWSNRGIKVIRPETRFHLSFAVGGRLFVRQEETGLMEVVGDSLRSLPDGARFGASRIYAMLPYDSSRILIATRSEGLFLYDQNEFTPFAPSAREFLVERQVYHGARLSNGTFAVATIRGGVVVIDRDGNILKEFDKRSGLQDENVWYVAADAGDGLWLALNNGLARVEYPSPLSSFDERVGLRGAVSSLARFNGRFYAATALGLFVLNDRSPSALKEPLEFQQVPGTSMQCWDLLPFNGSLLVATDRGVYAYDGRGLRHISREYSYSLGRSARDPDRVYVGLQSGLMSLRLRNGSLHSDAALKDIGEEIRSIAESPNGDLWLATRFQGVLRVRRNTVVEAVPVVERFGETNGLPPVVGSVSYVQGRILFDTEAGILTFDEQTDTFVPDAALASAPAHVTGVMHRPVDVGGRLLVEAEHGYFMISGVKEAAADVVREAPLSRITQNVELSVLSEPDGVLWFGGSDGVVRYDPQVRRDFATSISTLIRRVSTVERDSLVFGGTDVGAHPSLLFQGEESGIYLPYEDNALRFEYTSTSYDVPSATRFQYFLSGLDDDWSLPTAESRKDYTNLPPHWFTFHVRAYNVYGQISHQASLTFRVLPPWYRTWWAYSSYAFLSGFLVFGMLKWRTRELERKNRILEEKVEIRTVQLKQKSDDLARSNQELDREKRKSDSLLYNILPQEVAEELKDKGTTTPSRYDEVSIMFTDFKGFSEVVSKLPASVLVAELGEIYRNFDGIIQRHGIEKIKTIGDSYMIAAGLPKPIPDHALRCVTAAEEMLGFLSDRNGKHELQWTMRVGIHTGPVLAGVVGTLKFTYDVWGDTVNIASRMESSSEAGRINVSASTHDLIMSRYECERRGMVEAKGRGKIEMFFVKGERPLKL